jgi:sugar lactone lactonase YvrE
VVDAPSVTCKYCGNSVPVPAKYRPHKPQQPPIVIQQPVIPTYSTEQFDRAMRSSSRYGCIITVVILLFVGGIVVFSLLSAQGAINSALEQVGDAVSDLPGGISLPGATPTPAFAEVTLEFGGEGSGPGLFEDSRYIVVDPDGNIYVCEYDSGRLQKFDASGKFLKQITIEPDQNGNIYVSGLAADYQGNLYVSRSGDILQYSLDGELLATFSGDNDTRYGGLAVDANNIIYALNEAEEGLVKLDADGNELLRVADIISSVDKDDFSFNVDIAVDGTGQVFITSGFGNKVYLFDGDGKYIDRFGEEGTAPGQLSSPGAIAVDGRGRIYVDTFGGISVFNASGAYLGDLPRDYAKGAVFGIAVDLEGNIYSITNQGIVQKYRVKSLG